MTIRPAPDCMVYLTALLPVADGVSAYAALTRAADGARADGDPRSRGQVMADSMTSALASCGPAERTGPATALHVVMTDRALFGNAEDPAWVDGHGVVDPELARELARGDRVWLRRLFADPDTGELAATDSRCRTFPAGLKVLVRLRDQRCRTPWCDAPVRHVDHAIRHAEGGPTGLANAQGLCEACNQAKETTGWTARPRPGPRHVVDVITPTGHTYRSRAPVPSAYVSRRTGAERLLHELTVAV